MSNGVAVGVTLAAVSIALWIYGPALPILTVLLPVGAALALEYFSD